MPSTRAKGRAKTFERLSPMIRDTIKQAQISAMKGGEKERLAAVRLILAKIKDRDIELRTASQQPDDDTLVVDVLQKMAKQRRESITMYVEGNREELAEQERKELKVIEEFLPAQLSEDDTRAAIAGIKEELGASSIKDMGRVMAELKGRHGTVLDMQAASRLVKEALS
jgi:uncharacterized protein YqeY